MSERIVVGVDDSVGGRAALAWAMREADLRHATVAVVHSWMMPWAEGYNPAWAVDRAAFGADERAALTAVIDAERAATGSTAETTLAVVQGTSASQALMEAAEGADLLVVGSRGHGGFVGLALGSVSTACVHHAPCPVVVVRPEAVAPPAEPAGDPAGDTVTVGASS